MFCIENLLLFSSVSCWRDSCFCNSNPTPFRDHQYYLVKMGVSFVQIPTKESSQLMQCIFFSRWMLCHSENHLQLYSKWQQKWRICCHELQYGGMYKIFTLLFRWIKYIYWGLMKKSASFKLMNFMAPGSEVLVLRQGSNDYLGLGSVISASDFF